MPAIASVGVRLMSLETFYAAVLAVAWAPWCRPILNRLVATGILLCSLFLTWRSWFFATPELLAAFAVCHSSTFGVAMASVPYAEAWYEDSPAAFAWFKFSFISRDSRTFVEMRSFYITVVRWDWDGNLRPVCDTWMWWSWLLLA